MDRLHALNDLDCRLFISIFTRSSRPSVGLIARVFSRTAEGYLHVLIPALLLFSGTESVPTLFTLIACSVLIERVLYWLLKNGLKRPRPQDSLPGFNSLIIPGDKFSFPSGHTSSAFLLATALTVVYQGPVAILYLWASTVALSRVLLGVHYPGDTIAGALMGSIIVLLTATLLGI